MGEKNKVREIGARKQRVENQGEHKLENYIYKAWILLEKSGKGKVFFNECMFLVRGKDMRDPNHLPPLLRILNP